MVASSKLTMTISMEVTKSVNQTVAETGATSYISAMSMWPVRVWKDVFTAFAGVDHCSKLRPKSMIPLKAKLRKIIRKRSRKCMRSSAACDSVLASWASFGCPRKTEKNWRVSRRVYQKVASRWDSFHVVRCITRSSTASHSRWYCRRASGVASSPLGAAGSTATAVPTLVVSVAMRAKFTARHRLLNRVTQSRRTHLSHRETSLEQQTTQHCRRRRAMTPQTQTRSRRTWNIVGYGSAAMVSTWMEVRMPPLRSRSKRTSKTPNMGGSASAFRKAVCTYISDVAASIQLYALSMYSICSKMVCGGRWMSKCTS
mmetsp:Transcript_22907/g.60539  ORF Transcript_22907/g.60539 Transcript_22907/m.60539 type:complete len:314 (+) Transcript_22907:430-1371(+)